MATRTAQQRRAAARAEYDAFMADCPARKLLDRISDKWVSLVLVALTDGRQRYSDLNRRIAGVSQKMLTQTLRTMERDGLLTRHVTVSVPVRVDYELTPLGTSLLPLMAAIKGWAETHIADVARAQERYDASGADQ
ncbi:winged helix-turn-helix transcriptional regulator [Dactylosporangium sp. NPDC051541]|uniref:winged helix-turn-helix transcriptional regulator n=1 Tax=Dactylosporangium sp. NPDC051541 TaxID=3363977 RepID=UPI003791F830